MGILGLSEDDEKFLKDYKAKMDEAISLRDKLSSDPGASTIAETLWGDYEKNRTEI